jgi:uncharacterized protein YbaR (Trm112 family)
MNNARHPISAEVLEFLRCPATDSRLTVAEGALLAQINDAIARGTLHNAIGQPVREALGAVLINAPHTLAYPVIDGIPVMVSGESIPLKFEEHTEANQVSEGSP